MTEPDDLQRNAEATRRLRELVDGLDDTALRRPLGGGWTVAVALVHLAFWDGFQRAGLQAYLSGEAFPSEGAEDAVNAALDAVALLVDPAVAGAAAVKAAEQVDAAAAGLPPEQRAVLLASDNASAVRRWRHREEHLTQIEAALS